jgi:hypothetical protein
MYKLNNYIFAANLVYKLNICYARKRNRSEKIP